MQTRENGTPFQAIV